MQMNQNTIPSQAMTPQQSMSPQVNYSNFSPNSSNLHPRQPLSIDSPQNQPLNTPMSVPLRGSDEQIYQEKLQSMQKYIEPLLEAIKKNDRNDPGLDKMRNLYQILTGNTRTSLNVLEKCEKYLETQSKFHHLQANKTKQNSENKVPSVSNMVVDCPTGTIKSVVSQSSTPTAGLSHGSGSNRSQEFSQSIIECINRNHKRPMYFQVVNKLFSPILSVLNPDPYLMTNQFNMSGKYIHYSNTNESPSFQRFLNRRNQARRKKFLIR